MDQVLLIALLIGGGIVVGGIAGAVWAFRQPDPKKKKSHDATATANSSTQQQEV